MAGLVVFDLDGVLIDSRQANIEAFSRGLEWAGVPVPPGEQVAALIGLSAREMLTRLGCPSERVSQAFEEVVKPYYLENLPQLARAVEGAAEVLQGLRQRGYRMAACTSGDRTTQEQALASMGLASWLESMQTPDDSQFRKPQVEYLQELLDRLDYHGKVYHVEDSQVGLQMGLDWGATTIFADYGYGRPEPLQPHYRIQRLVELLEVLP